MRCLSIHQPWASAIVCVSKRIETRSWQTSYRGPLAIHAAKHWTAAEAELLCRLEWIGALWPAGVRPGDDNPLPLGMIVGTVELVDCRRTEDCDYRSTNIPRWPPASCPYFSSRCWCERDLGDFSPGRFAWVLANPVRFREPVAYRGWQGLFNVPDALLTC